MTDDEGAGRLADKPQEDSAVHAVDGAGDLCRGVRLAAVADLGEGTVVTPGGMPIGTDLSEHQDGGALSKLSYIRDSRPSSSTTSSLHPSPVQRHRTML